MTIEQIQMIGLRAATLCGARLYGDPKLENGVWTVGLKQHKEMMALQVDFLDRELVKDYDFYRAQVDMERTMQSALLTAFSGR